ncbi:YibE/F family protein [Jidongwangia harbinensis]|uniref:YibE/F family protein n=1 Tax=Jidongwangia harbinensis TaxID=2878561 RepID=UPI001CD9D4A7|nr:YibE/F family protein [Jidongwangia harbinensis]MCA2212009.1 YibE/F family protein [Jidongwangia harbinensis]
MSDGQHGHGHAHGPGPAASRRTRRIVAAALVPAALATLIALVVLWPGQVETPPERRGGERALGTVTAVAEQACPAGAAQQRCGSATVRITDGPGAGGTQTVDLPQGPGAPRLEVGDDLVLLYAPDAVPGGPAYTVVDQQRSTPLIWLVALAVAVILAFGRWRGLRSLAGLAVSFGILLYFVLPAILDGSPPLLVAVVGASAIMFAALYLTHGVTVHTSVAVAGTLASLVLTGILGAVFTSLLHLSGVGSDDTSYLSATQGDIDPRGLLLAGIVIGALGVLDDVTVTQAVTVAEMAAGGGRTRWGLYRSAIRVGRAHVGSAVNTIVLAYAGASLPLLLLIAAGSDPVGELLTGEYLAQEILRSAVGTIGLVASVPITTALAVLVADAGTAVPARPRHARL